MFSGGVRSNKWINCLDNLVLYGGGALEYFNYVMIRWSGVPADLSVLRNMHVDSARLNGYCQDITKLICTTRQLANYKKNNFTRIDGYVSIGQKWDKNIVGFVKAPPLRRNA